MKKPVLTLNRQRRLKIERAFLWGITCLVILAIGILIIKPGLEIYYAERFMDASIPDDAKHVRVSYLSWQGQSLLIKMELPPASVSEFLIELGLSEYYLKEGYDPHGLSHGRPGWWNPDQAKVFDGAEWRRSPNAGKNYKILIDKSRPDSFTIYLSVDEG